ncbi:MAG: hypothetical protein K2G13_02710, partial [Muribaculaceae bacterium]|nr:hypothetical protein [Muribaculaceae bacterium]
DNNDFDPAVYDGYYAGMTTKSGINSSWWHILSMSWGTTNKVNNKTWASQLALPTQSNRGLRYRTGVSSTAYSGWITVLDTSNYSNYALPLSGGSLSGVLHLLGNQCLDNAGSGALNLNNSDIFNVNSIKFADLCDDATEGLHFYRDASHIDSFWVKNGVMYFTPNRPWGGSATNYVIWHSGNMGAGSGLNADLLDGRHADGFSWRKYLGTQADTKGAYVILAPAYNSSTLNGGYFYGTVYITRGNSGSYNAKTAVMVQCGGQYRSNIANYQVLSDSVGIQGLYRIIYNGADYIALKMGSASTMNFTVEGYWSGIDPFVINSNDSGVTFETALTTVPNIMSNANSASQLATTRYIWG